VGAEPGANALHPLPSRTGYVLALRAANDTVEAEAARNQLLELYLKDHPELAPPGVKVDSMHYTAANIAATKSVEARLRPVEARLAAQLAAQQELIDRWQWFSPAILAQAAFGELAGAGWPRHRAFLAQVDAYLDTLRGYFEPRVLSGRFEFRGFDEWPRFAWREPDAREARLTLSRSLAGLVSPALLLALAGNALLGRHARTR
jgi:ABC-2 type transport system permease protein